MSNVRYLVAIVTALTMPWQGVLVQTVIDELRDTSHSQYIRGPEDATAYYEMYIPARVDAQSLRRWVKWLSLSDAQSAVLVRLYREYVERDVTIREQMLPEVWELSGVLADPEKENVGDDPLTASQMAELVKLREQAIRAIIAVERPMLDGLTSVLSDAQLSEIPRIWDRRRRQIFGDLHREHSAARVDLWEIFAELDDRDEVFIADREAFHSLLWDYERTLTSLLKRFHDLQFDAMAKGPSIRASRTQGVPTSVAMEQFVRLRRSAHRPEEHIVNLNQMYVELLADQLMPESAKRFLAAYQQAAFPQIYPNPFALRQWFDLVGDTVEFDNSQQVELDDLERAMTDWMDSISKQMEREVIRWVNQFLATRQAPSDLFEQHKNRLDELQETRLRISSLTIDAIDEMLGSELTHIANELRGLLQKRVRTHHSREIGITYYP